MATRQATFLRQRPYLAVSMTHFFVDVLNSGRTLLIAILAISLGLTNAQVGIALLLYNVSSALSQPLFGFLADRFGPRWLVVGGMGWMIFFYSLSSLSGPWLALIAVTFAGLGSGAFHPTGTLVASQVSDASRTQATAVFFMAGQMGLFIGPVLAGAFLESYGRAGYLALPLLSLIAFAGGWQWLPGRAANVPSNITAEAGKAAQSQTATASGRRTESFRWENVKRRELWPLVAVLVTINTVSIGTINFVPKLFTEWGLSPGYVGWTGGLLMLGAAVGGVVGGTIADRVSGRWVILLGAAGAVTPLYFYLVWPDPWRLIFLFLAGFFTGMPHSVLVLRAQSLLPGRQGLASGLILGLMFFSGAIGAYILGVVADGVGLARALQMMAGLPLVTLSAALLLPAKGSRPSPGK
jgi:MFS transporter, FSR family, fosmidomycin resistance protein